MITYSSVDRVLRQVDHITPIVEQSNPRPPEDAIHKCKLLDTEIPAITYNSGGTYTLGALQQAIDVLQVSMSDTKKITLLKKCKILFKYHTVSQKI